MTCAASKKLSPTVAKPPLVQKEEVVLASVVAMTGPLFRKMQLSARLPTYREPVQPHRPWRTVLKSVLRTMGLPPQLLRSSMFP